jgi:hypothetical protein
LSQLRGLVEPIELGRPHLMLTDVGRDDRLATRQPVQLVDHILRLDDLAILA